MMKNGYAKSDCRNESSREKCNWRNIVNCPLNGICLVEELVFTANVEPTKMYIGSTEGTFKSRYYNLK